MAAVDEQVVDRCCELVAGGSVHRPVGGERLPAAENLLDDDKEGIDLAAALLLQAAEIVAGGVEAVDVIDAQTGDRAAAHELERETVDLLEDERIFHAQRGELVDVEEAAVVDLFGGDAPVREAVRLQVQQPVERVEAARLPGAAVQPADAALDQIADAAAGGGERREAPLDDLLLARAHRHRRGITIAARRQVAAGGEDALQLVGVGAGVILEPLVNRALEHRGVGVRRDRQRLIEVADEERAVAVGELQLLALEHLAVLAAEDRDQDLVGELILHRVPLDVEEAGEARARAVLEDVEPPRVGRPGDAHMVGHEVHDVAHAAGLQRRDPGPVVLVRADLRVEARGIGDVVAVRAAGHRLQVRRGVAVADPQIVEIVHDRAGVVETEALMKLEAIRGKRNASGRHQVKK